MNKSYVAYQGRMNYHNSVDFTKWYVAGGPWPIDHEDALEKTKRDLISTLAFLSGENWHKELTVGVIIKEETEDYFQPHNHSKLGREIGDFEVVFTTKLPTHKFRTYGRHEPLDELINSEQREFFEGLT